MQNTKPSSLGQGREASLEAYTLSNNRKDDDPGLLFSWNHDALVLFIDKANHVEPGVVKPNWLHFTDGRINPDDFKRNLIDQLKVVGGGRSYGDILVSCNTIVEYSRVVRELDGMEMHPFMQTVMRSVSETYPEVGCLAQLAVVHKGARGLVQGDPIGPATLSSARVHLFD